MALTWPLARVFTTHLAGGFGDPHVTLWSMRWFRDAVLTLQNPFFTHRLYHPQGTTLLFGLFDLPSTLLVLPLWGLVPDVAVYNTAVLFAFALTAYGMFRLAREIGADVASALCSGIVFAAVPYHFAHLDGHLWLMAMGWLPLYLVHLLRIVSGRGRLRDAALAGVFLALASLASWYHLLFASVITAPLLAYGMLHERRAFTSAATLRQLLVLTATWCLLAGPLLVAMMVAKSREEILGAHDPLMFSADAYSFVYPSAIQTWCLEGPLSNTPWGPELAEHATYVGPTVLLLALLGAVIDPLSRVFIVVAMLGALLAMGPQLQWNGRVFGFHMPYWYLEHLIPGVQFGGVPARFGYVMYLGLVTAAAAGLARLRKATGQGPFSIVTVLVLSVSALYQYRACAPQMSQWPVPTIVRQWADDPEDWAILDVSNAWQQMWNATTHRKPIVGGFLPRVPKRLEDWILQQPLIRAIKWPDAELPLLRVDQQIDFTRMRDADPDLVGDQLTAEWTGTLLVPANGVYEFRVSTPAVASLEVRTMAIAGTMGVPVDGRTVHDASGRLELKAGSHLLRLRVLERVPSDATIRLSWKPPGGEWQVVPADALRTADGRPGLDAEYLQHIPPTSGLGRIEGRATLRRLGIRYVITADSDNSCVQGELELPERYRGDGVRIYAVPATDA